MTYILYHYLFLRVTQRVFSSNCKIVLSVFHLAISNMAQRHVAFCERHVALHERHVALLECHVAVHVRHIAHLIFGQ